MNPLPSAIARLRVRSITRQTPTVLSIVLESLDHEPLPAIHPGDHIDLRMSPTLVRSYSLVGNAGSASRYEIAVALDPQSRGGSRHVHEKMRVGDEVDIAGPRKLFELRQEASHSFLIAGGIGITPIWSMVQALESLARPWTLCYAARSRSHAAYLEDIEALGARSQVGRLILHFDDQKGGMPLDIPAVLALAPVDAHLYCCGPAPMLAAYERATANRPADHVHLERFASGQARQPSETQSFELVLVRAGKTLQIPADRSILDVMLDNGIDAPYGCMQGVCGMCEVSVLEGIPDHRDSILTEDARQSNARIIVCCSRSMTRSLTIDL
jgi:tetrachlorobenzoquinone reductase